MMGWFRKKIEKVQEPRPLDRMIDMLMQRMQRMELEFKEYEEKRDIMLNELHRRLSAGEVEDDRYADVCARLAAARNQGWKPTEKPL